MRKLYVYDSSSPIDVKQANGRFNNTGAITSIGVGSVAALHRSLNQLVQENAVFDRALFQTHGNSGAIFFNNQAITAADFPAHFAGNKYHKLFPNYTRLHFDGCNVAAGEDGWKFLEAAGTVFLRSGGGISFGWTSLGHGYPGWLPFIGGHTLHFTGTVRTVTIGSGGAVLGRNLPSGSGVDWSRKMCCFPPETPIHTPNGALPIGTLASGAIVYGWDTKRNCVREARIRERQDHIGQFNLRQLQFDSGKGTRVTDGHYFADVERGWQPSEGIMPGRALQSIVTTEVLSTNRTLGECVSRVHNLRVEGLENYFVGDNGLLVRDH